MRFLANENFPFPSIKLMRSENIFVQAIVEDCPGISDHEVIKLANESDLIILTFDKDYGEIIFKTGLKDPPAVIFFRYKGGDVLFAGKYIISLLKEGKSLEDSFIVIEENSYRQRLYRK